MDLCKFVEEKAKPPKAKKEPKINPETGEPEQLSKRKTREYLAEDDSDYDPDKDTKKKKAADSDDEDFNPFKKGNSRSNCVPGSHSAIEQLSIDASMEGLMASFEGEDGGPPYACVVATCGGKSYPSLSSLRRHYVSHDPDMYAMLVCPICRFVKPDDHPGDMRKHIMEKHDKDETWANNNVIVDITEKLVTFREATTTGSGKRVPKKKR